MRLQRASLLAAACLTLCAIYVQVKAQSSAQRSATQRAFTDADWPRYTGDLAGTRYSKLKQINTTNVAKLATAWTFAGVGAQQTPIVVDSVLYASTPTGVVALQAD